MALLVGALVFGFMLSSIGSLVQALDRQAALSEERMDEVKEYMRWRKLPRDLMIRMQRYYAYYYSRKTAFDEKAILGNLTPGLRFEVVEHTLKETIGKIPLFATALDHLFQMEVFPLLNPVSASPKEVIFNRGDASQALFFLIKGHVEVLSGVDGRVLYRMRAGTFFGEAVLTGRRRAAAHRAADTCDMLCISADDLRDLFSRRPREGRIIYHAVLTEHVRKERMRNLSLRLLVNRMEQSKPEDEEESEKCKLTVATMKLQMAWNKACDASVFKASNFNADETPDEQTGMGGNGGLFVQTGGEPPSSTKRGGGTTVQKPSPNTSTAVTEKLDRLERTVQSLIQKLDSMGLVSQNGNARDIRALPNIR